MPSKGRKLVRALADPLVRTAVGEGRRRELLDDALTHLPGGLRRHVDMSGWTTPELLAFLAGPNRGPLPPRRPAAATVALINGLAGVLPTDALLVARSITDTAPGPAEPVSPTLRAVLDRYLPESLRAFQASRLRGPNAQAEALLVAQLGLLHQVAQDARRAQGEDDDLALRIQDGFLRERFAQLRPSELTIDPAAWSARTWPGLAHPASPQDAPAGATDPPPANPSVRIDANPVVVFPTGRGGSRKLTFRLAVPKGYPATLGAVIESAHGAVSFRHAETRRWFAARRRTGFPSAQTDLTLAADAVDLRRLVVYAASPSRATPLETVLFVRDDRRAQTELPTVLANRVGAAYTVVCSGYAGSAGLVLRNESTLYPDLRSACVGFGYSSLTWLDADTPIV